MVDVRDRPALQGLPGLPPLAQGVRGAPAETAVEPAAAERTPNIQIMYLPQEVRLRS